ncbi:hypothetical protein PCA10_38890 [Metapseudomonas resinovorans NBRC 106553]|uniref:Uncharacterized protein n=1 Tax=Metapseudomonas resinovorans NBRC 106553 TaxID=1245471 RepID=S6AY44_METRE|nr:hypothetical protein PCA10_38890 [Pseudomonas resinovorans NBRC 106553]
MLCTFAFGPGKPGRRVVRAISGSADSPYVKAGAQAGYKGYNYQYERWATQDRPAKGTSRPDRRLRRGAM